MRPFSARFSLIARQLNQSVQLIMLDNAWMSLQSELHKRYGMLELLDAEPILIASDFEPQLDNDDIEFEWTAKRDLNALLLNFAGDPLAKFTHWLQTRPLISWLEQQHALLTEHTAILLTADSARTYPRRVPGFAIV